MEISLTKTYATLYDFYFLYKNYHWNIQNTQHFYHLHLLFDKHAKENFSYVDTVAERLRQMRMPAEANMTELAQHSIIREHDNLFVTEIAPQDMLKNLYKSHITFEEYLQKAKEHYDDEKDFDTHDLLVEVSRSNTQMRWFIESSIAKS